MKKSSAKNIRKRRILIEIIIVVVLIGIGITVFLLYKSIVAKNGPQAGAIQEGADSGENGQDSSSAIEEYEFSLDMFNGYLGNDPELQDHPKAPRRTWAENLDIPEYSGEAYILLNDGNPFFRTDNLEPIPWEMYYDLDEMGRCTLAEGVFGKETMPTEKRGDISSIKPTGWHSVRYHQELVDGESLYNRCHLVAFGLSGESANKYNLVTGTRYFNTDAVNAFENMVMDYIRETENHVRYRVTPVFSGDNLVCDGQVVEAWSIEDNGEGICFCIWSYNVQPGIYIDYLTGDNYLIDENYLAQDSVANGHSFDYSLKDDCIGDFVLNIKKKKIHSADCNGVAAMSEKNREDYSGSYNELIEQGFEPDMNCLGYLY